MTQYSNALGVRLSAVLLALSLCGGCDAQESPPVYDAHVNGGGFSPTSDGGAPVDGSPARRIEDSEVSHDGGMPSLDAALSEPELDAGPPGQADAAVCSADAGRAILNGPFRCADEPESVEITGESGRYRIFTYEASHPLATNTRAFPCARQAGQPGGLMAPDENTEACSARGVRPWFSVRWADAKAACEQIGWRLCTQEELTRACGGRDMRAFTFGAIFEPGACNLREAFVAGDVMFASESPTGHFEECVSPDGVYDLTGNLWEWNANEGDEFSSDTRFNQGAGWKTIAEHHRDSDMHCNRTVTIPQSRADVHASSMVGFRCCQSAP